MFGKSKTKAWKHLESVYKHFNHTQMKELFANDAKRAEKYTIQLDNMLIDYSKNRIDDNVMTALYDLARERNIKDKITDMFSGKKINITENRAVLHVALRNRSNKPIYVNGRDVMPQINNTLERKNKSHK